MGKQQEVFALIARLSGSQNKVVVDRSLCEYMGSLEGGVFLSQLLYWCDKGSNEWFYKSHKEWNQETFLSEYQVRQNTKKCVELGFLETKIKKANGSPTVHYKFNGAVFMDSILEFFRIHTENSQDGNLNSTEWIPEKLQEPITETTTETTTKKAAKPPAFLPDAEADLDGRYTMQLLRDTRLFFTFPPGAKREASALEELYTTGAISEAVDRLVKRHHEMVATQGKGIQKPIGYLAKILAEDYQQRPKPKGNPNERYFYTDPVTGVRREVTL